MMKIIIIGEHLCLYEQIIINCFSMVDEVIELSFNDLAQKPNLYSEFDIIIFKVNDCEMVKSVSDYVLTFHDKSFVFLVDCPEESYYEDLFSYSNVTFFESDVSPLVFATGIRNIINQKILTNENSLLCKKNECQESIGLISDEIRFLISAEQKLEITESLLATVIEQSPLGFAVIDNQGNFSIVNKMAARILTETGKPYIINSKVEILLNNITFYLPNETEIPKSENPILQALKGKPVYNREFILKKRSGTKIWIVLTATPVFNKKQEIQSTIVFFPDVTEYKNTLTALAGEKEFLRSLMDNIPDLIFYKDTSGRLIRINKAMAKHLSLTDVGLAIGKTDFDFYSEQQARIFFEEERLILKTGEALIDKLEEWQDDDKNKMWFSTTKAPVADKDGCFAGIVGISRDITNIKLSEQRLKEAKEKAEESDKLKTAFLSNMSHEIRTPMNAIIGFADLLVSPDLPNEKKADFIKNINDSCDNLLKLINDIIEIAKIQAGEVKPIYADFFVNEMLLELYQTLIDDFSESDVDLRMNISTHNEDVLLCSDEVKIKQVLASLIKNGLKFTEHGYVEFGYDIILDSKMPFFRFYVKDTGIGIQKSKLQIIFDTFMKVNDRNTKLYGGTGLGLAISKNLIRLLDGEMWVESVPEQGSTFYFSIPLRCESGVNGTLASNLFGVNKKVLVVEDDELNYIFIYEILSKYHTVQCFWAKNGNEAINILEAEPNIDLIFMDIKMPGMSGIDTTKIIKEKYNIPIIAQTAYAIETERAMIMKQGFDEYLSKPLSIDELENKINKWLFVS